MSINRLEVQNYLVFKNILTLSFCPGINVFIGGNATGKTTLLKSMYDNVKIFPPFSWGVPGAGWGEDKLLKDTDGIVFPAGENGIINKNVKTVFDSTKNYHAIYIPEKDILEHAKGLLTFIEQKQTGFSQVYKDVLIAAQDVPTQKQSKTQKAIGQKIIAIVGGNVHWDKGDGAFYTLKTDGSRIPFANEASGYKKLGFLGLLVSSGQLEPGSILFWDEPENSLNPELVPVLVDILLELSRTDVQIFVATHDYNFTRYFDIRKDKNISVMFHNLSKTIEGEIICYSSPEYIKLTNNLFETTSSNLFNAVVANAMGMQDDE